MKQIYPKCVRTLLAAMLALSIAMGQNSNSIKGSVTDTSGGVVPNATVTLKGPGGEKRATTDGTGAYTFPSVQPGNYQIRIALPGFTAYERRNLQVSGAVTVDAQLVVALEKQEVRVEGEAVGTVSTDASSNAGALVLKGADLEALSDDPDQLAEDLQALAGPSAGPNGGQIFIDGFSGGRLPPKSSIREIRINQNPFSAEYDRMGFGRIEILTKPGTDKFRGQAFTSFNDAFLNSRNPFLAERAPYQSKMFGGSISGPINKKSSFSLDAERRGVDENSVINATILSPDFTATALRQAIITPQSRLHITPRFDYQLGKSNTLVGRYSFGRNAQENEGVGQFSLASRGYNTGSTDHTLQLTETAIISPRMINETRFQFIRSNQHEDGDNTKPTIQVLDSFTGGGSQIGLASSTSRHWEITNNTTLTAGAHAFKFGARVRGVTMDDISPNNFGGAFTFSGGGFAPQLDAKGNAIPGTSVAITSIERYRRTLLLQSLGFNATNIRILGGGASQFGISAGNPLAAISRTDFGLFLTDDYRVRPNLTLSYGLRYEGQTNIHDWRDFSPRFSVAYGLGPKGGTPKTVLRAGFGVFYDRFSESLSLQALRYNGTLQQRYIVSQPDFFPNVPSLTSLNATLAPQSIYRVDDNLRSPYIAQTAIGVDRQLPGKTTMSVNYIFSRGVHNLRSRNINAPIAGSRPLGINENVFLYEASGLMRQNQLMINANSRASKYFSLFGFMVFNSAKSDTDGAGSQPADPYNLKTEYSNAQFDVHRRAFIGGSVTSPLKLSWSPFIMLSSGSPFNITTGRDANGDTVFNDRPSFAASGVTGANIVATQFGAFNTNPGPNDVLIPRNYARGPAQFTVNLRVSRAWGFGGKKTADATPGGDMGFGGPGGPGGDHGPGGGGDRGGRGGSGGGGPRGGGGGGPRGGGGFGGGSSDTKYSISLSLSARNLLNHVNLSSPNGNLSSPLFGQSLSTAGGFGPGGGSAAGNRRIDVMLRFSF